MSHAVFCLCCLQETAKISLTKKGLPTLHCRYCGSRTFFHSAMGVRGYLMLVPKAINAYRATLGQEPLELEKGYEALRETYGLAVERALARQGPPTNPPSTE